MPSVQQGAAPRNPNDGVQSASSNDNNSNRRTEDAASQTQSTNHYKRRGSVQDARNDTGGTDNSEPQARTTEARSGASERQDRGENGNIVRPRDTYSLASSERFGPPIPASTWHSMEGLLQSIARNPRQQLSLRHTVLLIVIPGIIACFFAAGSLAVGVWQGMLQKEQTESSSDSVTGTTNKAFEKSKRQSQKENTWPAAAIFVATLLAGFLLVSCVANVIFLWILRRKDASEKEILDVMEAVAEEAGQPTELHLRTGGGKGAKYYSITLQQVSGGRWKFVTKPFEAPASTRERSGSSSDGYDDDEDTDYTQSSSEQLAKEGFYYQGEVHFANYNSNTLKEFSAERFRLVDTQLTPKQVLELGEGELRQRYRNKEALRRSKEDEERDED